MSGFIKLWVVLVSHFFSSPPHKLSSFWMVSRYSHFIWAFATFQRLSSPTARPLHSRYDMWMGTLPTIAARNGINYLFAGISRCVFFSRHSWGINQSFSFHSLASKFLINKRWNFLFIFRSNTSQNCTNVMHTFLIRSSSIECVENQTSIKLIHFLSSMFIKVFTKSSSHV